MTKTTKFGIVNYIMRLILERKKVAYYNILDAEVTQKL